MESANQATGALDQHEAAQTRLWTRLVFLVKIELSVAIVIHTAVLRPGKRDMNHATLAMLQFSVILFTNL